MKNQRLFFTKAFLAALFMVAFGMTSFSVNAQDGCAIEGLTYIGSYNGSDYYLSDDYLLAGEASAAAASYGGHLATIADEGENLFVAFGTGVLAWIGFNDVANEGDFVWETGEPVTYTNWYAFEPNNCCGGEHWTTTNWGAWGAWNDLFDGTVDGVTYYIQMVVEFDDADCDGVSNCNDVCDGGDDNGPCSADELPEDLPEDWYCSNNDNSVKVLMCHNGTTICVSENAVPAHLAHGDFLGPCAGCGTDAFSIPEIDGEIEMAKPDEINLNVYPNPSTGDFRISLDHAGPATIQIFDQNGQVVKSWDIIQTRDLGFQLQAEGMYFVRLTTDNQTITKKITVVD